jgi:lipopolysaccharide/colanic/teichoic acid biosynthesis glycosyltransferase
MSVVGPRPHALKTRTLGRELADVADQYAARHRMKPGLTGLAQVSGFRGELDTIEKVQKRVAFDIDYIRNWSFWLDVKIVARTVLLIVYDPRAY